MTSRFIPEIQRYIFLASLAIMAACGPQDPSEKVGTAEGAYIGGSPLGSGTATAMGDIKILHSLPAGVQTCSGTLLRNDIVLTARHCVTDDATFLGAPDRNGAAYTLSMDSQIAHASEIVDLSVGELDYALIVVTPFFKTGSSGNAQGWFRPIYSGTNASLVGTTLTCEGYGQSSCPSPGGLGTLTSATLKGASSTSKSLTVSGINLPYLGDSGSTCFTGSGEATLVENTGWACLSGEPTTATGVGPQSLFPALNQWYTSPSAGAQIFTLSTGIFLETPQTGEGYGGTGQNTLNAGIMISHNYNPPPPASAVLETHHPAIEYSGPQWGWGMMHEDATTMTPGESFNVSVGSGVTVVGTDQGNLMAISSQFPQQSSSDMFIVTPIWNPTGTELGVFNDHATGVWWDGSQWWVYNEDFVNMPSGVAFNLRKADPADGGYIHTSIIANIVGNYTILDNVNINGQPGAKIFFTHVFTGKYLDHPTGVQYIGSSSRWVIFNEDGAAMPTGVSFNVEVLP